MTPDSSSRFPAAPSRFRCREARNARARHDAADRPARRHQDLPQRRPRSRSAARHRPRDQPRRAGRDHGRVGLGQEHADEHPRLPRPADRGQLSLHGPRRVDARPRSARRAAPRIVRLRVPELQPDRDRHRDRQRRDARGLRRPVARRAPCARGRTARHARPRGPHRTIGRINCRAGSSSACRSRAR